MEFKKSIKYRDHKGSLDESLSTVQEFTSVDQIINHINKSYERSRDKVAEIKFQHIGLDEQTGWDTYYVLHRLDGNSFFSVAGMSDGCLETPIEIINHLNNQVAALTGNDNKINPNIFDLSIYDWPIDYDINYMFFHINKTIDEFKADFNMMLVKYGKEYIQSESGYAKRDNWAIYAAEKMEELGYIKVKLEQYQLILKSDISNKRDELDEIFEYIVGKQLIDLAAQHNKNVDKEIGAV